MAEKSNAIITRSSSVIINSAVLFPLVLAIVETTIEIAAYEHPIAFVTKKNLIENKVSHFEIILLKTKKKKKNQTQNPTSILYAYTVFDFYVIFSLIASNTIHISVIFYKVSNKVFELRMSKYYTS